MMISIFTFISSAKESNQEDQSVQEEKYKQKDTAEQEEGCDMVSVNNIEDKITKVINKEYEIKNVSQLTNFAMSIKTVGIVLKPSDDADMKINATYSITASSKEEVEKIANVVSVTNAVNGNTCSLDIVSSEDGTNMWTWLKNEVKDSALGVELIVYVPDNFNDYSLINYCGDIEVNSLSGDFSIQSKTGTVKLKDTIIYGNCLVTTNTGSIQWDLNHDTSEDAVVTFNTDTGSVLCDMNAVLGHSMNLSIKSVTGSIVIKAPNYDIVYNKNTKVQLDCILDNMCKLTAKTTTGTIKIN